MSEADDPARQQLRGSTLLLAGRLLSMGINFAAQVLIVRYLSTQDYGALAFALTIIALLGGVATLGLPGGLSRFAPLYHERGDHQRLWGALALSFGVVVATSTALIVLVYAGSDLLTRVAGGSTQSIALLLVLVFVIPLEGLERLLIALFASFAHPWAVFFRRHVLAPGFKLAVAALLVTFDATVAFVAYGYLVACLLGLGINARVFVRVLRDEGMLRNRSWRSLKLPVREMFGFTAPLMVSELVVVAMHAIATLLLSYHHGPTQVAYYRAILPAANLNTIVMGSFALLYLPAAARLLARNEPVQVGTLYWRTAVWMAVLSFPAFVVTFSLAEPVTLLLFGSRYEESAILLQLLAAAYYFNVALGFNSLTLKVVGRLRFVVLLDVVAIALNVLLGVFLIPTGGARGAALATAGAMVAHNVMAQAGLRMAAGISVFEWRFLSFYLLIIAGAAGLFALQQRTNAGLWVVGPLAALVSLVVLVSARRRLDIEDTFPELVRLPILGPLLRTRGDGDSASRRA